MVSYKKKFTEMKERQLMQKARDCIEKGEKEKGIDCLTKVIESNPNNCEALRRRLEIYYGMGQYELSFADTKKALLLAPATPELHGIMAMILYQKGDYDGSLASSTAALDILAKRNLPYWREISWECYVRRADVYATVGKYQDAISDCGEAISLNPNAESYFQRAYIFCEINEHEKALADIKKAILLNPNVPNHHKLAAKIYFNQQDFKQAISEYQQILSLVPNDDVTWLNMGNAYLKQFDLDNALRCYDEAIKVSPDAYLLYYFRALVLGMLGEKDRAEVDIEKHRQLGGPMADIPFCAESDFSLVKLLKEFKN